MIPHHVAIIMDGNRRWAKQHHLEVLRGHAKGSDNLRDIARACYDSDVCFLTCFAFSSENWRRSSFEVDGLIRLMKQFLKEDVPQLKKDNVKLRIIGDLSPFDDELQELFESAIKDTSVNTGLNLSIAVNYGGQQDMLSAIQKLLEQRNANPTLDDVKSMMQTSALPKVDLLIRTGGERRISNFMLWDCAYAELYFSDKFWPDFNEVDLANAFADFKTRDRRYGGDSKELRAKLVHSK